VRSDVCGARDRGSRSGDAKMAELGATGFACCAFHPRRLRTSAICMLVQSIADQFGVNIVGPDEIYCR
jgi:hypothetical protein